ncbi:uncharacterized protein LOC115980641 [Quercus lobata]|uniref:uncharacterized protein LOC115980641 n=1 Tax=Quercus lobata TaxID=97700 RepID=UPI001245A0F9|nr:uncharacterized protein LOC115980641 [Quercus lobata]
MYPDLFEGLGLKTHDLAKYDTPLVSFDGRVVIPEGQISLTVDMEGKGVIVTFIVVRSFSPYTAILGRPWIHAMKAVPSTLHMKVKFPTEYGVAEKPRGETGADVAKEVLKVRILPDTDKYFQIGTSMNNREKVEMLLFLLQNVDVFAWNPYEVPGVDPEFIVHKLNVDPSFPPKKQKPRRASKEHVDAVNLEVQRLKEAGVIKEIFFLRWLANTVVVKKKNDSGEFVWTSQT